VTTTFDRDDLIARVRALAPWFHNLDLEGVATAPEHFLGDYPNLQWQLFGHAIPDDLHGRTVLDVGCNAGFFSIKLKQRGADQVVGIDSDPRYLAQAALAAEVHGVDVTFKQLSVYDVARLRQRFDIVLFMGVLYHLRHPLLALDLLHEHVVDDVLVFQSMLRGSSQIVPLAPDHPFNEHRIFDDPAYPKLHFVEHRYAGDPTNWWIPNQACAEAMVRSAGFEVTSRPAPEVLLCRRTSRVSDEIPPLQVELAPARRGGVHGPRGLTRD
jgi:tRNA (mo5U34)-methyltransferase